MQYFAPVKKNFALWRNFYRMLHDNRRKIEKVRETLGFSQEAMAKFIKCSPRSWKGYESNSSVPGGDILANLANAGIDTNWILSGNVSKSENSIDIYDVEFSAGCGSFITEENIVSSLVLPEDFFDIYEVPKNMPWE